jgi:hypothetical protein
VAGETSLKIYELNPRHLGQSAGGDLHASVAVEDVVVLVS